MSRISSHVLDRFPESSILVHDTRGATRRVPDTNGYPPNSGRRTRTRHRVNPALQGAETGSTGYPGTRTPCGPVYGQAGLTSG